MPFSISGLLSSRENDIGQWALAWGSILVEGRQQSWNGKRQALIYLSHISVLKWKKACINLFITYFNIELKRTKLTSHTDTKLIWIWVIDTGWGMITVLLWKKLCIVLFIERLDIMLSEFCPDICSWADIAVALPVFTHGQNWRYYL